MLTKQNIPRIGQIANVFPARVVQVEKGLMPRQNGLCPRGVRLIKGDLHIHTYLSDGTCAPERVCDLAMRAGLSHIALTDHDYISDFVENKMLGEKYGLEILVGVEFSTKDYVRNRRVHVLCYLPNDIKELEQICLETTKNRFEARHKMACAVADKFPITVEDILKVAEKSTCLFKQHIMQTLIEAGFATQMYGELYSQLFGCENGNCTVSYRLPDVYEVISAIKRSGGICVMAHPYTYDGIDFLNESTKEKLFDGVEVWSSKSSEEQESYLLDFCLQNGLIPTGGSDFHGANSSVVCPIGVKPTPNGSINAILKLKEMRK